jgi:hypothetical protein
LEAVLKLQITNGSFLKFASVGERIVPIEVQSLSALLSKILNSDEDLELQTLAI